MRIDCGAVWDHVARDLNFEKKVQRAYLALAAEHIQAGNIVGLQLRENLNFLVFYQACYLLKAKVVILSLSLQPASEGILDYLHVWVRETSPHTWAMSRLNTKPFTLPEEIAVVCRSSGTTRSAQYIAWHKQGIDYQCQATCERMHYTASDRFLMVLPLFCSYGLSMVHIWQAKKNGLIIPQHIYAKSLVQLIEKTQATSFHSIPRIYALLYRWLVRHPEQQASLASVRVWDCGGDKLPQRLAVQWLQMLGLAILDGYGLTEAGPNIALNGPYDHKLGTVGKPLSAIELKLTPDKALWVRTPGALWGTLHPLEKRIQPFPENSWLATSDLASLDEEGYLKIYGRKNNQLIINGWNVSPERVEETLLMFPGIEQVGVIGVTLRVATQLVAFLQTSSKMPNFSIDVLRIWCKKRLPMYAIPQNFFVVDQLPLDVGGKVNRRQLSKTASHLLQGE